jgi:hypothetical protein
VLPPPTAACRRLLLCAAAAASLLCAAAAAAVCCCCCCCCCCALLLLLLLRVWLFLCCVFEAPPPPTNWIGRGPLSQIVETGFWFESETDSGCYTPPTAVTSHMSNATIDRSMMMMNETLFGAELKSCFIDPKQYSALFQGLRMFGL